MSMTFTDRIATLLLPPPPMPEAPPQPPPALSAAASTPALPAAAVKPPVSQTMASGDRQPMSQRAPLPSEWQTQAWAYYRHCGEARQAVNWIANGLSRFHLFIGRVQSDGSGDPEPVDEPGLAGDILAELYNGPVGQREMLQRLAVHLLVVGESWLIGYPSHEDDPAPSGNRETARTSWVVASRKEWQDSEGGFRVKLPKDPRRGADNWVAFDADDVVVVPVYQPDPEDSTRATSAFEAAMGVLDELDGLSRRVGADINSRLAGAGIFAVPESSTLPNPGGSAGGNPLHADPFLTAITQAMMTAIADPDSASAVAPIVVKVPDEAIGKLQHITFSTPFDAQLPVLREDSRRRIAAVMDIPASIVTGVEELNHWTAWQVDDSAVKSHIGPLASLICSTITTEILWPTLKAAGEDEVEELAVWWDASELVLRPDRSAEALEAYKLQLISGKTARRALAYNEEDAPKPGEFDTSAATSEPNDGDDGQADVDTEVEGGAQPVDEGGQATPGERPNPPARPRNRPKPARPTTAAAHVPVDATEINAVNTALISATAASDCGTV